MKVSEVMTRDVITATPETPIHEAARLMVDHRISGLPVVVAPGTLVGIVTEGDLIVRQHPSEPRRWWRHFFEDPERLARDYRKRAGTTVAEVMTRAVISVSPELPVASAAFLLDRHRIRRVPVVLDSALVGIVSRGDLIKALALAPPPTVSRADSELEAEMRRRIAAEPWASVSAIVVQAAQGVLSLWGIVGSEAERSALETMARTIDGVKGVENRVLTADVAYHYAT